MLLDAPHLEQKVSDSRKRAPHLVQKAESLYAIVIRIKKRFGYLIIIRLYRLLSQIRLRVL